MTTEELELLEKMGLSDVKKSISKMVTGYEPGKFSEAQYEEVFEEYVEQGRPAFQKLEMICVVKPDLREVVLEDVCAEVVKEIRGNVMEAKKHWWSNKQSMRLDRYKMIIVGYLNPAVLDMKLRISEEFCEKLREMWLEEFPKEAYEIASEKEIASGFNQSWFYFG